MFRYVAICWLVMPTLAAAADQPVSPEEFEQLVTGETISYLSGAGEYGIEEYFDNRRVIWSHLDGRCTEGYWYADGPQVCFIYDGSEDAPQCWTFFKRDNKLLARFENATSMIPTRTRSTPMSCMTPEVGV